MKKILVVEDERDLRRNLDDLLEGEGFQVLVAEDGFMGYQLAVEENPDLIISDICMPLMDGFDLIKKIQANPLTASIPFIFLTAKVDMKDIREGMTCGADDYITKPFKIDDILKAINSRLKRKENYLLAVDEIKKDLIKKIPHELRTPLVGILGWSEIMQDDIESLSKEELIEMAGGINRSGKRLHRRIEKFLIYAQLLENNEKRDDFLVLDNGYEIDPQFLSSQLAISAVEYDRSNNLNTNFQKGKMKINGKHYEIVLNELLENAVKFSNENSEIKIEGLKNGKYYKTVFTDEGKTTEKFNEEKIDVFNKAITSDNTIEGLGLGLSIVKKIAEIYGGYIKIESEQLTTKIEFGIPLFENN